MLGSGGFVRGAICEAEVGQSLSRCLVVSVFGSMRLEPLESAGPRTWSCCEPRLRLLMMSEVVVCLDFQEQIQC